MNFVGNNIFFLVASAAFLPCNNSSALNSSLSHKALDSTHSSTCCSRTSFQVHWIPLTNSWALQHFIFLIMLSVYYFLTEIRVKFFHVVEAQSLSLKCWLRRDGVLCFHGLSAFAKGSKFSQMLSINCLVNWAFQKVLALETLNSFLFLKIKIILWYSALESWTSYFKN